MLPGCDRGTHIYSPNSLNVPAGPFLIFSAVRRGGFLLLRKVVAVAYKKKKTVGAPPKYKTAAEMQEKIDTYFADCEGELLQDENGPVLDKFGNEIYLHQRPPTVTGLALALGFASRQALLNYQGRKEFNDTITRAKARCEQYAEERLYDRDGTHGAQFSLRANFGWNDKPKEQPAALEEETPVDDLSKALFELSEGKHGTG
nr:MAG TPA: DNA packaging protein gp3 [Caudoviricetes sp.]